MPEETLEQAMLRVMAECPGDAYRRLIAEVDRRFIPKAMNACNSNQVQTSELLGISRMTLRSKLRAIKTP